MKYLFLMISMMLLASNISFSAEYSTDKKIFSSTFIGGSSSDVITKILRDSSDNSIFILGYTSSEDFPTTQGVLQRNFNKATFVQHDLFIMKLDSAAQTIIASTYFGGFEDDYSVDMEFSHDNRLLISGYTMKSQTFPQKGIVYDSTQNGGFDQFILKINKDLDSLIFSAFLGGNKDDFNQGLEVDKAGNIYLAGYTNFDGDYPRTINNMESQGLFDAFVSKLTPNADSLISSYVFGGTGNDFLNDIKVYDNYVYLTGTTESFNFPVQDDSYQKAIADTSTKNSIGDAFLVKMNDKLTWIINSTYLGGSSSDNAFSIDLDKFKNIYVCGFSNSHNFPTTSKAYDSTYNNISISYGSGDVIISKFDENLNTLLASTYIGGWGTDKAYKINIDQHGFLAITGFSTSFDYPVYNEPIKAVLDTAHKTSDIVFTIMDQNLENIYYSSFIGGIGSDYANNMILDKGSYIISGGTASYDFPLKYRALDSIFVDSTQHESFLFNFDANSLLIDMPDYLELCFGDTLYPSLSVSGNRGGLIFSWTPDYMIENTDKLKASIYTQTDTTYYIEIVDQLGFRKKDSVFVKILPLPDGILFGSPLLIGDYTHAYSFISDSDSLIYQWETINGSIIGADSNNVVNVLWPKDSLISSGELRLTVTNQNNCIREINRIINFDSLIDVRVVPYSSLDFCEGDSVILDAGSDYLLYSWSNGLATRRITVKESGDYWVQILDSNNVLRMSDTLTVQVWPLPEKPSILYQDSILVSSIDAYDFRWYRDSVLLEGEDYKELLLNGYGYYQVEVFNIHGCSQISDLFYYGDINIKETETDLVINIYPNPCEDILNIDFPKEFLNNEYSICDILGNEIIKANLNSNQIKIDSLASGTYYLKIQTSSEQYVKMIIKL